jgi:basic amino acid/polyamine antiporter, APA family
MAADDQPQRRLGAVHVYAICTGAMFSSGFFLLPGLAVAETGPSVWMAYLLAGVLVVPAMLSTAELATAFPRAGGPYHFFQRSLGPPVAVIGAVGLFVAMVLKAAFALVGIGAYLTIVVDVPIEPVAAGLAVAFTVLNLVGARESAGLQVALVAVLLVVLAAFVGFGALEVVDRGAEATDDFSPLFADGALGLLSATGLVFVSYAGVLQVASIAGSVREPGRTIPRGLFLSLATATAVYVIGTALMVAVLPLDELAADETPVATAVEVLAFPFGTVAVVIAALAAFASTGNAGIMSASRYPLALARDDLLPSRFARLGRFGTPTLSVVVTGAVTAGLILVLDVEGIAKLASAFLLVVFALLNASVVVLRSGRVTGYLPTFRVPLHPWTEVFGVVAAVVLIVDLGLMPALFSAGVIVVGGGWYLLFRDRESSDPSTVMQLLHRVHAEPIDEDALHRLQEEGPRHGDCAADVLHDAEVVVLAEGTSVDELDSRVAECLAGRLGVSAAEARHWTGTGRHLRVDLERDATVLHHVLLDQAPEPTVVVGLAPVPGDEGRRARAVAVVAGPSEGHGRSLRIAALLANQLCDPELLRRSGDELEADRVREVLVTDANERQGSDPAR